MCVWMAECSFERYYMYEGSLDYLILQGVSFVLSQDVFSCKDDLYLSLSISMNEMMNKELSLMQK